MVVCSLCVRNCNIYVYMCAALIISYGVLVYCALHHKHVHVHVHVHAHASDNK